MKQALLNEEFPCIIYFDSLSFKIPKQIPAVNHNTLPLFYNKCEFQWGYSCRYHGLINIFTLTRFSWEYIPLKI